MRRDFSITGGIYLSQPPYEVDLHNNFDFVGIDYSIQSRTVALRWERGIREGIPADTPASLTITFREVSEFRFHPRDKAIPFTEDDCMNVFGYWTDEDWSDGVILIEPEKQPDPTWSTAIEFMSGAVLVVQASSASAKIAA